MHVDYNLPVFIGAIIESHTLSMQSYIVAFHREVDRREPQAPQVQERKSTCWRLPAVLKKKGDHLTKIPPLSCGVCRACGCTKRPSSSRERMENSSTKAPKRATGGSSLRCVSQRNSLFCIRPHVNLISAWGISKL